MVWILKAWRFLARPAAQASVGTFEAAMRAVSLLLAALVGLAVVAAQRDPVCQTALVKDGDSVTIIAGRYNVQPGALLVWYYTPLASQPGRWVKATPGATFRSANLLMHACIAPLAPPCIDIAPEQLHTTYIALRRRA
jgi:hypothetical protein